MVDVEGMRGAANTMVSAADTMRNAASELWSTLELDRQQREEQIARLEQAAELNALAALLNHSTMISAGQMQRYGEWMHDPGAPELTGKLEALLKARGVL